ncbi:MAG: hydrolase [Alphaproteobacteria bacterium]|nr:hydrolase [Alphaproteobacteria bacterium]
MLIEAGKSCLVIIDVQERLAPVMHSPRDVLDGCSKLIRAASRLSVPVVITEQYPKGLGQTMFDVRDVAPQDCYIEKDTFSCSKNPQFMQKLQTLKSKQIILAGIEAHICVLQTALGLKEIGFDVFVVADASSSRTEECKKAALHRMRTSGIECVTTEMVLFEWLERSGTPEFKEISALIK